MPKHYAALTIACLLSIVNVFAQCNYKNTILATCGGNNRAFGETISPKSSIQMGSDFLFASLLKCDYTSLSSNLELVLFDACGNIIRRTSNQLHCANNNCLPFVKVFSYTPDTALLAMYGSGIKVYKLSKDLNVWPILVDSPFVENFIEAQILPNSMLAILHDNEVNCGLKIYHNGVMLFNHVTSALSPNGFWISNIHENKLYGHALHNPYRFLELTLDSNGNILKDTLFGNTSIPLNTNNYRFSFGKAQELKHLAMCNNQQVNIYPVFNYTIGSSIISQSTFIEQAISKILALKTTDSGEILLQAIPESYLWNHNNSLVSVIPRNPSYFKPGGTSAFFMNYTNESMHVTYQELNNPGNLVLHLSGSMHAGGAGFGGSTDPGIHAAATCYVQNAQLTLTGMTDTITKLPYTGSLAANVSVQNPWDVKWIFNRNLTTPVFSPNFRDIVLSDSMFTKPLDTFRACVVSYFHGSLPLKTCKNIYVKNDKVNKVLEVAKDQWDVSIFPNPTQSQFTLTLKEAIENVSWELYSSTGSLVQTGEMKNTTTIDLTGQASGCYFLKINHPQLRFTKLIFKE